MAQPPFPTAQYASSSFVESSGAILFTPLSITNINCPSPQKVCLLHYLRKNEWMLAKGRRNIGESRAAAAIREVREETGYPCRLLPVRMSTRAPAAEDRADVKDEARWVEGLCEPFMVSVRELGEGKGVKFIWWFVAVLIEDGAVGEMKGEEAFRAEFVEREEAVERLTFETDKEVLRGAIALLEGEIDRLRGSSQSTSE